MWFAFCNFEGEKNFFFCFHSKTKDRKEKIDLTITLDKEAEGEAILKKVKDLGGGHMVAMTEWGKRYSSVSFAEWSQVQLEKSNKLIFVIAGAEGFASEVLNLCQERLSLSELTFPHKLARILLVEQLYRAQTIRAGHPYHN